MSHVVLKQRHTLVGKNLLPMILEFKNSNIVDVSSLARLKKDHPWDKYSIDELVTEFRKLTGENTQDVLMLAGRDLNLDNVRCLLHSSIIYANTVGQPKGQVLSPVPGTSSESAGQSRQESNPGTESGSAGGVTLEVRMKKMEENISSMKNKQTEDKVTEALKNVRVLASRPKLTNSSVLIAALEVLVDCAIKAGHAETEYYTKALQTCRQYEDHDDLCSLCLKLLGSSEDKKISSIIVDWAKTKKYEKQNVTEEIKSEKVTSVVPTPTVPNYPFTGYPYPMPTPQFPMTFFYPPNISFGRPGPRFRGTRRRGTCFMCKATNHFVNECPKLKSKVDN